MLCLGSAREGKAVGVTTAQLIYPAVHSACRSLQVSLIKRNQKTPMLPDLLKMCDTYF